MSKKLLLCVIYINFFNNITFSFSLKTIAKTSLHTIFGSINSPHHMLNKTIFLSCALTNHYCLYKLYKKNARIPIKYTLKNFAIDFITMRAGIEVSDTFYDIFRLHNISFLKSAFLSSLLGITSYQVSNAFLNNIF